MISIQASTRFSRDESQRTTTVVITGSNIDHGTLVAALTHGGFGFIGNQDNPGAILRDALRDALPVEAGGVAPDPSSLSEALSGAPAGLAWISPAEGWYDLRYVGSEALVATVYPNTCKVNGDTAETWRGYFAEGVASPLDQISIKVQSSAAAVINAVNGLCRAAMRPEAAR